MCSGLARAAGWLARHSTIEVDGPTSPVGTCVHEQRAVCSDGLVVAVEGCSLVEVGVESEQGLKKLSMSSSIRGCGFENGGDKESEKSLACRPSSARIGH